MTTIPFCWGYKIIKTASNLTRIALFVIIILALFIPAMPVSAAVPTITTSAATNLTESGGALNGTLISTGTYGGPNVYLFFQYCTNDYYLSYANYDKKTTEVAWLVADGDTTWTTTVSGLGNATEYHYRAALRYGTNYVYGADDTFNTAIVDPDTTPNILSLRAYKNLLENNDCLFVILCDIPYSTIPGIPVSRSFIWSLIDTGSEQGWNTGYAMNDNGYGLNIYSLYFPAASAITWGSTTKYNVQLSGSPEVFTIPPIYDSLDSGNYAVTSDVWVSATDYKVKLAADLITVSRTIEQDWQVVLLDEQDTKTVLSSNGEKLFRNAINGVQTMAPSLFFVQTATADTSARVWGTSLSDSYKTRLAGVDGIIGTADDNWIAGAFQGLANWINIPFLLMIGFICIALCVYVIYKSNQKFGTAVPGYVGSLIIILCFSMLAMGMTAIALIGIALVIAAGWLLFMRRA